MAPKNTVEKCSPRKCSTRQTLIDAAHSLIWPNSYAHVSVEDICRAAGVQKGSFYHFFPTKIDLALAAMQNHWDETRPTVEALFDNNPTPQALLRAMSDHVIHKLRSSLEASGKVCGCPYATLSAEMNSNNEALRALSDELNARFIGYYERVLKTAADAKLIPAREVKPRALEMYTYVIGAMTQARISNQVTMVEKTLENALFRISGMDKVAAKAVVAKTARKKIA